MADCENFRIFVFLCSDIHEYTPTLKLVYVHRCFLSFKVPQDVISRVLCRIFGHLLFVILSGDK